MRKFASFAILMAGLCMHANGAERAPVPSELVGAIDQLIRGGEWEYTRATVSGIVLSGLLVHVAIRRLEWCGAEQRGSERAARAGAGQLLYQSGDRP